VKKHQRKSKRREMRANAMSKWIGYPANKVRLVLDMIRGMDVEKAQNSLKFSKTFASKAVEKTLKSAVANLYDKFRNELGQTSTKDLVVSITYANEGPTLKRFKPGFKGSASRIRKRTSHIFVEVSTQNN